MQDADKNEGEEELSPFASIISTKILDKLEKQIDLAKAASLKCGEADSSSRQKPNLPFLVTQSATGAESRKSLNGKYVASSEKDKISLEATLKYTRLKKEFSKLEETECKTEKEATYALQEDVFSEDVDFILNMIRETKRELKMCNNFSVFKRNVVKASLHLNAEHQLKTDIVKTHERISKIKEEIRTREMEMSLEEQEKVGQIERLKDEHHLTKTEGKEALKFTEKFFEAQSSNASCSHENKADAESKKISQINQQIDRDVHCLAVMESWTDDFCQQLEAKIDEWKRKLRGDELVMDMRIDAKRRAIKSQEELIKSLNETIAERLEELAPWEEEKEVERQERLAHMRRYYSARKLQRWWRAYMVKLKLYKRRKAKPKI